MSRKPKTEAKADPTVAFRATMSSLDSMLKRIARIHRVSYTGKLWTPVDYHHDDPAHSPGCDIILTTDGQFLEELYHTGALYDQVSEEASKLGLHMEHWSHFEVHFMFEDENRHRHAQGLAQFDWVKLLLTPAFDLGYRNLFEFFARNPSELQRLDSREFELLLASVLRAAGFRVDVGNGTNDGGVDMVLISHDFVGEIRTIVQAKRYAADHPIDLTAVQALTAVMDDRKANRALFATTSRFLPSTKAFAENQRGRVQLVEGADIVAWLAALNRNLKQVANDQLAHHALLCRRHPKGEQPTPEALDVGDVIYSQNHSGYMNSYALVVEACPGAALAVEIPAVQLGGDGQPLEDAPTTGHEVPLLDEKGPKFIERITREPPFVVRVTARHIWGKRLSWTRWTGGPVYYDWND